MIKKQTIFSVFFLSFIISVSAQVKEIGEISLGKKFAIESTILNQTKEIQVYVPESYTDSIKLDYPVLYLLDGQRFFTNGVAIQKSLRRNLMRLPVLTPWMELLFQVVLAYQE